MDQLFFEMFGTGRVQRFGVQALSRLN